MKTKSVLTVIFLFLCSFISGQVPDSLKYISIGPFEFQQTYKMYDKALLVDVREFFEFKKSRIKNAVNIPSSGDLEFVAETLNRENSLFLYCTSGYRSKRVARFFFDKGFTKLYSLDGGINAWKKEGYPVDKKRLRSKDKKQKKS